MPSRERKCFDSIKFPIKSFKKSFFPSHHAFWPRITPATAFSKRTQLGSIAQLCSLRKGLFSATIFVRLEAKDLGWFTAAEQRSARWFPSLRVVDVRWPFGSFYHFWVYRCQSPSPSFTGEKQMIAKKWQRMVRTAVLHQNFLDYSTRTPVFHLLMSDRSITTKSPSTAPVTCRLSP